MPHLRTCNVHWPMIIYSDLDDLRSYTFVHQFNSPFWLEHNWNIAIEIEFQRAFYRISPKKNFHRLNNESLNIITHPHENHNYHWINSMISVDQQTTNDLSSKVSSSVKLLIINEQKLTLSRSIVSDLFPVLNAIHIRSLHLIWSNLLISDFVELLNHLPNLNSLAWFSSLNVVSSSLSTNDEENLRLFSISNTITQVSLQINFEQIQFLIRLCPRMEKLEVHGVKNDDLGKLLRFILMETRTSLLHLHLLYLTIIDINDEIVHNLQTLIDSEDLLSDYTIKYRGNHVALERKIQ
ncbi:unnamed protein product [Adineta ricciae]|uniref:Uncharacterized protein n=1 Tax=Adineta ricciae TaxID=249248 RepID=A0A814U276_ADIRI|nr:unnamed protein product [Adineta ricciae]CAF1167833.1 unnamed protein product [Adineta ricciae]